MSEDDGLKGVLVSVAIKIPEARTDYSLAVNSNQPTLRAKVESAFDATASSREDCGVEWYKGHGRIERRAVGVVREVDWLDSDRRFPGEFRLPKPDKIIRVQSRAELFDRSRLETRYNISSARLGKRHLAIALGRAAILAGYAAQFTTATALVAGLVKAQAERRLEERLLALSKPRLLIVDELGYLPLEPQAAHLFFQLVSRRYEKGAMLITSNRNVGEWGTVFADPVVATAILDRLLHHSHVVTIRGESYRLRAMRRSRLLQKPVVAQEPLREPQPA